MCWGFSHHPLFLVETMAPQLKIARLMCARQSFVKSRAPLEDNAQVLMEYDNGAIGSLWSSAVNCGSMHGQKVRIVGEKPVSNGGMNSPTSCVTRCRANRRAFWSAAWTILIRWRVRMIASAVVTRRGCSRHGRISIAASPSLWTLRTGATKRCWADFWYPDARAGAFGVRWVENCVRSADNGACWVDFR